MFDWFFRNRFIELHRPTFGLPRRVTHDIQNKISMHIYDWRQIYAYLFYFVRRLVYHVRKKPPSSETGRRMGLEYDKGGINNLFQAYYFCNTQHGYTNIT